MKLVEQIKKPILKEMELFERKFRDAFTAKPTALLTVISNQLPRFVDKSDGVWRRMFLLKIANKVSDEKIDFRFIDPKFWVKSGELSGILNRALEGLKRLNERHNLTEVAEMSEEKNQYRYELNPVRQFITEYCVFKPMEEESSKAIYRAYRTMCKDNGNKPFSSNMFARQFKLEAKLKGVSINGNRTK